MIDDIQDCCLYKLSFHDRCYNFDKRFSWEDKDVYKRQDMTCELDKYKVLALPMVYMFKEGFAKKVRAFVENGGTLITSRCV